jgi:ERF superfamily
MGKQTAQTITIKNATVILAKKRYKMEMSRSNTTAMSDDIRALAQAFLLAKQEFLATGKSGKNTQFGKYAKIEDIYHAVQDALGKNNIIIWHYARPESGAEYLITRLVHVLTGQFLEDVRTLESEKPGNQAKGSANTYMKKYAVLSLCAIPTEDDDGEEERKYLDLQEKQPQSNRFAPKEPAPKPVIYEKVTREQEDQLEQALDGYPELAREILLKMDKKSLADIPKHQFSQCLKRIDEIKRDEDKAKRLATAHKQ